MEKQLEDDINFWVTIRYYKEVNAIENMKSGKFKVVEFLLLDLKMPFESNRYKIILRPT